MSTLNYHEAPEPNFNNYPYVIACYKALIARCKAAVKAKETCVYDPETGIQKWFLDGKLTHIKHVRS